MENIGSLAVGQAICGLVGAKAFLYEAEEGRISVRLETKKRGSSSGYWFAYKRYRGKLLKMYLCEAYAWIPGFWIGWRVVCFPIPGRRGGEAEEFRA